MIASFKNQGTEDIFNGVNTGQARKTCPEMLWKIATRKIDQLDSVVTLNELRIPPGNHLESLAGNRKGQHSIRVNDQYGRKRGQARWKSLITTDRRHTL
jgi:proteic killer suppression protein